MFQAMARGVDLTRGDPGSPAWYVWLHRLLDAVESENVKDFHAAALTYYVGVLPIADSDSRRSALDAAAESLQGMLEEIGFAEKLGENNKVHPDEEAAYYEMFGKPGEKEFEQMLAEGYAAFDALEQESSTVA